MKNGKRGPKAPLVRLPQPDLDGGETRAEWEERVLAEIADAMDAHATRVRAWQARFAAEPGGGSSGGGGGTGGW